MMVMHSGMAADDGDQPAFNVLRQRFPVAFNRLERATKLDKDLQHKAARKRRLSTLHMLGPAQTPQTLRIYIHHSYSDTSKSAQGVHRGGKKVPSWTLYIEGGIMDDDKISRNFHFSQFFDSINISFDRRVSKITAQDIEWVRPNQGHVIETDGFETTQMGDKDAHVRISFHRRVESPFLARRRLTPELAKLLKLRKEERLDIIETTLFDAIANRLEQEPEPGYFTCDADFQKVFGVERFHISIVAQLLSAHLSEPEPFFVDYEVSNATVGSRKVVDITVEPSIGGGLQTSFNAAIKQNVNTEKETEKTCRELDRKAAYIAEALVNKAKRMALFRAIAENPSKGLLQIIGQQESFSQLLADDSSSTMPDVIDVLQRVQPPGSHDSSATGEQATSRWLTDAIQQYLAQQPVGAATSSKK